jgi:hypothetical protein
MTATQPAFDPAVFLFIADSVIRQYAARRPAPSMPQRFGGVLERLRQHRPPARSVKSRTPIKPKAPEPLPVEKLLYSRKDAAFALSISVRALDYRIEDGRIKTQKQGRKVMITAAELKRYARSDNPSRFK